jgi:predicted MFS family arabinose efflux permease
VFSKIRDKNIWVIYAAILILGIAYGIAISLVAHHLDGRGFTKPQMGSLASWFALGIVALSLPVGWAIRKLSAKSTLVACLAGYSATVTLFPALNAYPAIALDRFFDGAFSVGIWVSCETILLSRADRGIKAYVTSLYAVAIAIGYVVGPLAAEGIVRVWAIDRAFLVSGALAAFAMLFVFFLLDPDGSAPALEAVTEDTDVANSTVRPTRGRALFARIKTSCFATFAYGYFQASVVLFLPLYLLESKGVARERTIIIPFFFALGMLLFSNVAGRLGDRYGHLLVMRALAAVGTCMVLGFVLLDSYAWMAAAVFVAGATLASISPVSLALQGVVTAPRDYSRSNAIYNACYAAGMLLGPKASSLLFARWGGGAMLLHLAALWLVFVVFTVVYRRDDPRARGDVARDLAPSPDASATTGCEPISAERLAR